MTRRELREGVFLLLFQNEISSVDIPETAESCVEAFEMDINDEMKIAAAKAIAGIIKDEEMKELAEKAKELQEEETTKRSI